MSLRLAVLGASGRMGRAVVRLAHEAGDTIVLAVGATDVGHDAGVLSGIGPLGVAITPDIGALSTVRADAVVDFSTPAALPLALEVCAREGVAFASGTTGLDDSLRHALISAAQRTAVLWEPNMSVGIHVLSKLLHDAICTLGEGYDIEIVEAHHRMKVDAPSGTAIRLADVAKAARGGHFVTGREGKPGARKADEIGMLAVRGGDVIGDHTIHLLGDGERLELTHRASSRDLFARGALRAARWLVGKPPRLYGLKDVLSAEANAP
jgi:4-hydroxy-tetrahydrodipicolinate reductase